MDTIPNPAATPDPPRPIMDLDRSLARMGGDRALLQDVANFYFEDSQELLTRLESALTLKDSKLAARSAHSISGLSANFNAERCSAVAKAIEEACEEADFQTSHELLPTLRNEVAQLVAALKQEFSR